MTTSETINDMKTTIGGDYLVTTRKQRKAARATTLKAYSAAPGSWLPNGHPMRNVGMRQFTLVNVAVSAAIAVFYFWFPFTAILPVFALSLVPVVILRIVPIMLASRIHAGRPDSSDFQLFDSENRVVLTLALKGKSPMHAQATGLWAEKRSSGKVKTPGERSMIEVILERTLADGRITEVRAHAKNWVLFDKVYAPLGFTADIDRSKSRNIHIPIRLSLSEH
jgi:hypothetical protein